METEDEPTYTFMDDGTIVPTNAAGWKELHEFFKKEGFVYDKNILDIPPPASIERYIEKGK